MEKSLERKPQVDTVRLISKYPEWIQLDMQLQYPHVQTFKIKQIRSCLNSRLATPYHVLDYILATLHMPDNCKVQWEDYYAQGQLKIVVDDSTKYEYKVSDDGIILKSKQWDNYKVSAYYDTAYIRKKNVAKYVVPKWMRNIQKETYNEITIKAIGEEWAPEEIVVLQSLLESIATTQWDSCLCVSIAKTVEKVLERECKVEYEIEDKRIATYKKGEYVDYANKKTYQWQDKENWKLYNAATGKMTQCAQGNMSTNLYVLDIPIQEDTSAVCRDVEAIIDKVASASCLDFQIAQPLYYMSLQENVVNDLTLHELLDATGMLLPEVLAFVKQMGLQEGIHLWKENGKVYVQDRHGTKIWIAFETWYGDIIIEENGMEVRYEQVKTNLFRRRLWKPVLHDGSMYEETIRNNDTICYEKGNYRFTLKGDYATDVMRQVFADFVPTENVIQTCSSLWNHPSIVKEQIVSLQYSNEKDNHMKEMVITNQGDHKHIRWISSEKGVRYELQVYSDTSWNIRFEDNYVLTSDGSYMYGEENIMQFSKEEAQHIFTTYILPIAGTFLN